MAPDPQSELSWKKVFADFATPVLPELDPVFSIRVDVEYYYSVIRHAVLKAKGEFTEDAVAAFLQDAVTEFYDLHKGKPQAADRASLERAEALVQSPAKGQGGKTLRADCSSTVKKDVVSRLLMRRYGGNQETAKRAFAKEAILAKVQRTLSIGLTG